VFCAHAVETTNAQSAPLRRRAEGFQIIVLPHGFFGFGTIEISSEEEEYSPHPIAE
jgi:hypothetical protein